MTAGGGDNSGETLVAADGPAASLAKEATACCPACALGYYLAASRRATGSVGSDKTRQDQYIQID